jgi:hypothetical protein
MNAADQFGFAIALKGFQTGGFMSGQLDQALIDVFQTVAPIVLGFTAPQQIQIGAVQYQYFAVFRGHPATCRCGFHKRKFAANEGKLPIFATN